MEGRRRTSLPKRGWLNSAHVDVRENGQTEGGGEIQWGCMETTTCRIQRPHMEVGINAEEEEEKEEDEEVVYWWILHFHEGPSC